jgi:hypothetical protein
VARSTGLVNRSNSSTAGLMSVSVLQTHASAEGYVDIGSCTVALPIRNNVAQDDRAHGEQALVPRYNERLARSANSAAAFRMSDRSTRFTAANGTRWRVLRSSTTIADALYLDSRAARPQPTRSLLAFPSSLRRTSHERWINPDRMAGGIMSCEVSRYLRCW